jgi:hypothetical protein
MSTAAVYSFMTRCTLVVLVFIQVHQVSSVEAAVGEILRFPAYFLLPVLTLGIVYQERQ